MTLHLWLMNLANYSAQISALIIVGSVAPLLLRVRRPQAMLVYRQLLLAACLLLPFLQPWKHPPAESSDGVSISATTFTRAAAPAHRRPSLEEIAGLLLCAGILARAACLALGLWRLRRHRRGAERLSPLPPVFEDLQWSLGVRPLIGLSSKVSGPVTFGIRNPVILLPSQFLDMPAGAQRAIACHEMAHVRRRDWAFTLFEEIIRAVFWFHPCVWWLLGQIQLSREQAVDSEVIAITASREQYVDALLAVAGGRLQPDLAPAPLFLQRSHLSQRVAAILKGVSMSRQRLFSSLAAICGALLVTARLAVFYFPISAPAQEVLRGEANLLHRAPIDYPADALAQGIQGTVIVEATLNQRGVVTDARVISGPEALRRSALKSVLDWHYTNQAQSPVEVAIDFTLPPKRGIAGNVPGGVIGGVIGGVPASVPESGKLNRIQVTGVSTQLREALIPGHLPVRVGDEIQADALSRVKQAIREVDEHLDARLTRFPNGEFALQIYSTAPIDTAATNGPKQAEALSQLTEAERQKINAAMPESTSGPQRIRVGGNVQAAMAIYTPKPAYPPDAKQSRVQGVVRLNVVIGKDGEVKDLRVASGEPLLAPAALDAVRHWIYKPTLLNGAPVEVVSVIDVNFTLSE